MNYSIKIVENVSRSYSVNVEAEDEKKAVQLVTEKWYNGEISNEDIEKDSETYSDESELLNVYLE